MKHNNLLDLAIVTTVISCFILLVLWGTVRIIVPDYAEVVELPSPPAPPKPHFIPGQTGPVYYSHPVSDVLFRHNKIQPPLAVLCMDTESGYITACPDTVLH